MSDPDSPNSPTGDEGQYPPPSEQIPPPPGGPTPPPPGQAPPPPPGQYPPPGGPTPSYAQPPPPQYPQFGYTYGAPPVIVKTNGLAIASMVSGIAGIFLCILFVPSILAVVFGHVGLTQIKRSAGRERGKGMAIAGLVLGYLGVVAAIVWIIVVANTDQNTTI